MNTPRRAGFVCVVSLFSITSLSACGGSPAAQNNAGSQQPLLVLGGELSTANNNSIQIGNSGRTMLLVHAGETVRVLAHLDPSARSPTMSFSKDGDFGSTSAMTPVAGLSGQWEQNFTLNGPSQGTVHGFYSFSVQASDDQGHTSSAPVGTFFFSSN